MGWFLFILWIILISIFQDYFWAITIGIVVFSVGYYYFSEYKWKAKKYDEIISEFNTLKSNKEKYNKIITEFNTLKADEEKLDYEKRNLYEQKKQLEQSQQELQQWVEQERNKIQQWAEREGNNIERLAKEKSEGFPWLAKAFSDYFYLQKLKEANYLERKSHPAPVSAEKVREMARERRVIEEKLRFAQGIINYYQDLFPFLEEFLGDIDEEILKKVLLRNIEEPIKEVDEIGIDPVRIYLSSLSEEEYQKLSSVERNQRALDKYWSRPKSKWQLGRDYERYIGYVYETNGYNVYYQGILEGFDDLGRDLICKKGAQTIIVQCKRWSQRKTIHEKHVNQLYGTVIKYTIDHPNEKVGAILYTTTKLSDRAKDFAKYLLIGVAEEFKLPEKYPSIKCNISRRNDEKIYHLPFDQQYDRTLIEEERNECYVETVEEAEKLGYRRAWRWRGETKKT